MIAYQAARLPGDQIMVPSQHRNALRLVSAATLPIAHSFAALSQRQPRHHHARSIDAVASPVTRDCDGMSHSVGGGSSGGAISFTTVCALCHKAPDRGLHSFTIQLNLSRV